MRVFQLRVLSGEGWPGCDIMDGGLDSAQRAGLELAKARNLRTMLDSVYRVPSADSLAHLLPDSVFARAIRFEHHWPVPAKAETLSNWAPRYRLIGTVPASDTLAYVVVERTMPSPPVPMPDAFSDLPQHRTDLQVMTIRRFRGQWRSMLDVGVNSNSGFFMAVQYEDSTTNSQRPPR